MTLKSRNRIPRPKDFSKISNAYNTYQGDLEDPQQINVQETISDLSDFRILEDIKTPNLGGMTTQSYDIEVNSDAIIKEMHAIQNSSNNGRSYDFNLYYQDNLIFTQSFIGMGVIDVNIPLIVDTKEKEKEIYTMEFIPTDGFGQPILNFSLVRTIIYS